MRINGKLIIADKGKVLTKDGVVTKSVCLGANDIPDNWTERDMTAEEIEAERETFVIFAEAEIKELKEKLEKTDYKAIKYAEGFYTDAEYAPIKNERQALRDRINELEELL